MAMQQMVAIARAVHFDCQVLILDEPTSSLDDHEVENLFNVMRNLKADGVGIIFVTHFLEQVYALCDRITVLRNGELQGEFPIADLPRQKLVATMLGHEFDELASIRSDEEAEAKASDKPEVIKAVALTHTGTIKPFELTIHKGEVIGFAGLLGSGRTETAELLFGINEINKGSLSINGKQLHLKNPMNAMEQKIGFCPEDRKLSGIIGDLSVRENIILAMQAKDGILRHIPYEEQVKIADDCIKLLRIKVSSREQLVKNLSGGNQQKVIIARWLATQPDLLILDEPTRGIDVGTKTEIQKMAISLAKKKGMAVVFISSEMDEMVRTCTKLVVMRDRRKVAELTGSDISSDGVMKAIAGGAA